MTTIAFSNMTVEQEGEGDPVILVHGLGGTSNSWQTMMPVLGGKRVVRPDLPGAGRSPTPFGAINVRLLADAVVDMAGQLGISRAHFVGHSFGTLIVQHIAMLRPDMVVGMALFGPIIEPADGARTRLRDRANKVRENGLCSVVDQIVAASLSGATQSNNPAIGAFLRESHMRQDREGFAKSCEALAEASKADLTSLDCPVLIVTGEEDGVGSPDVAYQLSQKINGARTVILPDCGHWAPFEKASKCQQLLSEFLG